VVHRHVCAVEQVVLDRLVIHKQGYADADFAPVLDGWASVSAALWLKKVGQGQGMPNFLCHCGCLSCGLAQVLIEFAEYQISGTHYHG
jgi:hypothetical protein